MKTTYETVVIGYGNHASIEIPDANLAESGLQEVFHDCNYSTRKEYCRLVSDAKADETRDRRIRKIIDELKP